MTKTELLNYSPILLSKYFLIGVRSWNGIVSEVDIPTDFQAEMLRSVIVSNFDCFSLW